MCEAYIHARFEQLSANLEIKRAVASCFMDKLQDHLPVLNANEH